MRFLLPCYGLIRRSGGETQVRNLTEGSVEVQIRAGCMVDKAYTVGPGCTKTLNRCKIRDNYSNFYGEPYVWIHSSKANFKGWFQAFEISGSFFLFYHLTEPFLPPPDKLDCVCWKIPIFGATVDFNVTTLSNSLPMSLSDRSMAENRSRVSEILGTVDGAFYNGGFDKRLKENAEYLKELEDLAAKEGVSDKVVFIPSCSTEQRDALLSECRCVLYTPTEEHFGIVPLEAMAAQKPVIACNSGGPLESIKHNITGFLCEPTPQNFSSAMLMILNDPDMAKKMGMEARIHVKKTFSREVLGETLNRTIFNVVETNR